MKKIIILVLICILSTSIYATSNSDYYSMGTNANDFNLADSISLWNDANTDYSIQDIDPLSNPNFMPLAGDLDGDGTQELIILSSNSFSIKQVTENSGTVLMTTIASFTMDSQTDGDYYSNVILNDIDGDSELEIIVHQQINAQIYIIGFNGTHAIEENKISFGNGGNADSQIGCNNNHCIIVFNTHNTEQGVGETVQAGFQSFDNDSMIDSPTYYYSQSGVDTHTRCFPKMGNVIYANSLFYFVEGGQTVQEGQFLRSIETNSTGHIQAHSRVEFSDSLPVPSSNCARGWDNFMPPTSLNFNEEYPYNHEIFVAYQSTAENFKFSEFAYDLTELDVYPALTSGEGIIISPPIGAKAFSQSQTNKDICVVGYEAEEREIEVICASKTNPCFQVGIDNVKFEYDMTNENFNITPDTIWSNIAHSIQATQSSSQDEILTPYGVFELEDYCTSSNVLSCKIAGICDMDKIWTTPVTVEAVHTALDLTNSNFQDIIALSEDNLYYIDDGFTNKQAYLSYCTKIEPDIDSIWALDISSTQSLNGGIYDTYFATSYNVETGLDDYGTPFNTYIKDGVAHILTEDTGSLNMTVNITDVVKGETLEQLTMFGAWNSTLTSDYLNFELWNYNTSTWDLRYVVSSSSIMTWHNFSISPIESYLNGTNTLQIRLSDEGISPDNLDSSLIVDYFAIDSVGYYETISSNQSNQVKITTKVSDPNSDDVASRVILYYGETNAQDTGWSNNVTSGSPYTFQNLLYPNESTSNSILRIYYTDVDNYGYDEADYIDYSFIVQNTGDFYYESNSCKGYSNEEYENSLLDNCTLDSDCESGESCNDGVCINIPDECTTSSDCPTDFICSDSVCEELPEDTQNAITDTANEFSALTGVPLGVLILLILGYVAYLIFKEESIPNNVKLPTMIIVSLFGVGAFVKLGLLSVIWIILFIFVLIAIIGLFVARFFGGNSQ